MLGDLPLVSIIIPTFRRPEAALEAIYTVRSQSYQNWEVIIVDDNPPESKAREQTRSLLSSFVNDQIHYIEHDENRGACAARNTGVKNSSGSLIAFLDDDDLWAPEKLKRQVNALLSNNSTCICICSVLEVYREGQRIVKFDPGAESYRDYFLNRGSGVTCSAIVIHRAIYERVQGFDEDLESYQDLDLILRALALGGACSIDEPLVTYRLADSGISKNLCMKLNGIDRILTKFKVDFQTVGQRGQAKFLEDRADHLFLMGSFSEAASQYFLLAKTERQKLRYQVKGVLASMRLSSAFRVVLMVKSSLIKRIDYLSAVNKF